MLNGSIFEQRCYVVDKPWFSVPAFPHRDKHAVVVGAGLAGLSAAWALVRRGWTVTLVDRGAGIAEGASGNPAGLLMPRLTQHQSLDSRFYINAYIHAIWFLERLQSITDHAFWFKSGSLLTGDSERLKRLQASHQFVHGFIDYVASDDAERVSGVPLNRDALSLAEGGWVKVKRLCEAIRLVCGDALTYRQTDVADICRHRGVWHIVDGAANAVLKSECVIVASGAAATQLPVLQWLPVDPVRGQLTIVSQTDISRNMKCPISAQRYITPAHEGRHVVGASYTLDDDTLALSSGEQQANIDGINALVPGMLASSGEPAGRVSFRAVSTDRVPVAGCVPDLDAFNQDYHDLRHGKPARHYPAGRYLPGLYVTTAHGSRGLTSCFLSAELIASMACGDPMPVEKAVADYLNPARFIIRQLKRKRD